MSTRNRLDKDANLFWIFTLQSKTKRRGRGTEDSEETERANITEERVCACGLFEGQLQPAKLRQLRQKVAQGLVKASEVSNAVVAEIERVAQLLSFWLSEGSRVHKNGPQWLSIKLQDSSTTNKGMTWAQFYTLICMWTLHYMRYKQFPHTAQLTNRGGTLGFH